MGRGGTCGFESKDLGKGIKKRKTRKGGVLEGGGVIEKGTCAQHNKNKQGEENGTQRVGGENGRKNEKCELG